MCRSPGGHWPATVVAGGVLGGGSLHPGSRVAIRRDLVCSRRSRRRHDSTPQGGTGVTERPPRRSVQSRRGPGVSTSLRDLKLPRCARVATVRGGAHARTMPSGLIHLRFRHHRPTTWDSTAEESHGQYGTPRSLSESARFVTWWWRQCPGVPFSAASTSVSTLLVAGTLSTSGGAKS